MGYGLGVAEGAMDLAQALWSRMELPTQASELLSGRIRQLHDQMQPGDTILIVAHSRGAIETRNALVNMPREVQKRVISVSVAPGSFIEESLCGQAIHFVSTKDPVPYTTISKLTSQNEGTVTTVSPLDLKGRGRGRKIDHDFMSPSYQAGLREVIEPLIGRYEEYED